MSAADITAGSGLVIAVAVLVAVLLGRTVKAEVGAVRAEFRNNGGSSFKDAMDRQFVLLNSRLDPIENRQKKIEAAVFDLAERVDLLEACSNYLPSPTPMPSPTKKRANL